MKLAKPRIDIGFATNNAPPALTFWQNQIGLPFDYTQPIRRGYKQHRHDLCGSILKINQVYDPLPDAPPAGYRELLIARDGIAAPLPLVDPDGNRVSLVPRGMFGIERIGIRLGVRDVEAHRRFYTDALGLPQGNARGPGEAMTYSQFVRAVDEGNVASVVLAKAPGGNTTITGKTQDGKAFATTAPAGSDTVPVMLPRSL